MITFEIEGKEYELKLNLKSVKYLNSLHDEGGFMLIQKAISGDLDTYIDVVYAGLMHTGEGFTKKKVEKAIDEGIADEKLDLDEINRTMYNVVAESFFYKRTVEKLFAKDKEAKAQIEAMMK